ncbi:MAG: ferredoxin-type protein NapG [Campylobacteraceae bacterium]|jgi:ferredoxin-type protein NapG|nr:ferredoxin-type protein NapG [Campylobacteraceae bacterium]
MTRREILKSSFKVFCIAAAGGFVWSIPTSSQARVFLRPPGACDEFLSKCIKCSLCVNACPYDTLKITKLSDKTTISTPYFEPRSVPCYMCDDIPCVAVCPTGALDKNLVSKDDKLEPKMIKMGVAVVDMDSCVAYAGLRCDACYRACPLLDEALYLKYERNERTKKHALLLPIVNSDICTGCGKCERACITKKAAITVIPRELVLGEAGDTYIKGWVEGADEKLEDVDTSINLDSTKVLDYLNTGEF